MPTTYNKNGGETRHFLLCHKLLYILRMIGDAVGAEETATVLGDEHIVLDADTTEVFVGFQQVEVQELCTMSALAPVVDEGRDEIDAPSLTRYSTRVYPSGNIPFLPIIILLLISL